MSAPHDTPSRRLLERLADSGQNGLDPVVLIPLLKLLAHGEPVEVADLAAAAGLSDTEVRARLAAVPDTEYDDAGRIVGQGLTLRPTPHRLTVDGQELYTWCALDTLIFPTLLERAARVESVSAASGQPITIAVEPDRVTRVGPATAVVSVLNPDGASIRSSFCNQVHFFTSNEDAADWLADHPEGQVLPVADAYQLATDLTTVMHHATDEAITTGSPHAVGSEAPTCCQARPLLGAGSDKADDVVNVNRPEPGANG
ncbi:MULTISPECIES: organomercurial lyase MerB [Bacteria]